MREWAAADAGLGGRPWRIPGRIRSGRRLRRRGVPPGAAKTWCAGPTEPGNVFVMFFQTPIYE